MLEQIQQIKTKEHYADFVIEQSIIISSADDNIGIGNLIILHDIITLDLEDYTLSVIENHEEVVYGFHDFFLLQDNKLMVEESLLLLEIHNKLFNI